MAADANQLKGVRSKKVYSWFHNRVIDKNVWHTHFLIRTVRSIASRAEGANRCYSTCNPFHIISCIKRVAPLESICR